MCIDLQGRKGWAISFEYSQGYAGRAGTKWFVLLITVDLFANFSPTDMTTDRR